MNNIALGDAMFLLGEAAGRPAQVITLQLYRPPVDADPQEWVSSYFQQLLASDNLKPVFTRRPARRLISPSTLRWIDDEPVELDHHVRHSALPGHGRVRELLEAVSVQHGVQLDRRRPLWEFHVFEGLEGGRFATAFKTHHAIADGMSLAKHVLGALTPDPDARGCLPPWAAGPARPRRPQIASGGVSLAPVLRGATAVRSLIEMGRDESATIPFEAPPSPLNVKVGGARRFAGDQWPLERLKAVANAVGGTVNDVGLAMAGGALRSYLDEIGGLPDRSLIAMVPVSVRREGDGFADGEGNAFGAMLCDLGTNHEDPVARVDSIRAQTRAAKERFAKMSAAEVLAVSKLIMGGAIVSSLTGITALPRHPFNLIISNVPAPNQPLYYNGAQMTDIYPVSMISEAQAMNITLTRYDNQMTFGIVGDRKALPHLQRMLIHLDGALEALEKAVAG
ncbi:wax ester/triacylglycerol synthase family O-acyltransferase [Nocardioides sp. WS12]|uniref:WS/DGAT/MGAT family O-acyltransferase n=1 Tax=Nocardioides sp. WS12 TaxID=2486272 RepID=UPI0015FBA5CA|nr:wax ester/triacylglycerol synthase family O-acyltransferase [Nocardioides sp. WS12]